MDWWSELVHFLPESDSYSTDQKFFLISESESTTLPIDQSIFSKAFILKSCKSTYMF